MFLTQLCLDRTNRKAMKLLSDVYSLHMAIMSGFAAYTDKPRVLFRVEPEVFDDLVCILIQSEVEPSWGLLADRNDGLKEAKTKKFSPAFRSGDDLRFRLRANAIVTRNGKRYGLIRDEALEAWLRKKGERLGVEFRSMSVTDEGYIVGNKEREDSHHRLNLKMARFEGYLHVTDADKLVKTLVEGIGPAKAFGCGLLSLARV
jgi:CRISPR system Cascade subunit CasE